MNSRRSRKSIVLGASLALASALGGGARSAHAADVPVSPPAAAAPEDSGMLLRIDPAISLDPTTPQVGALPGGVAPAYGQRSLSEGEWRFDFHGFITAPLNAGINTRPNPMPGQSKTVLHAPPVVPDDLETFSHTGVVPTTYVQLNFSEGNSIVSGNVSILARQANASTSFLEPASQLGITDVFLSVTPPLEKVRVQALLGAFTLRYGSPGEYDEGRYGTPLIARINGVGEDVSAKARAGQLTFMLEEGLMGQSNKASSGITPDVSTDFADPAQGSTFVAHAHAAVGYAKVLTVGGHALRAFSRDDRAGANAPDGSINIFGGDVRLTMGRFGHLYFAVSHVDAVQSRSVSRIISVLNTRGGKGLMDNYLGNTTNILGDGKMTTIGGQYDLSVGKLVSYPVPFYGDGPDLFVSVFGMQTHVSSPEAFYDNVTKRKVGVEATYSVASWLAFSGRYDYVAPFQDSNSYSFAVVSPRIILRTDWQATDQLVIQYSHWIDSSLTTVRVGDPPVEDPRVVPDTDMLSISATMWW